MTGIHFTWMVMIGAILVVWGAIGVGGEAAETEGRQAVLQLERENLDRYVEDLKHQTPEQVCADWQDSLRKMGQPDDGEDCSLREGRFGSTLVCCLHGKPAKRDDL